MRTSRYRQRRSHAVLWTIAIAGLFALVVFASWSGRDWACTTVQANNDSLVLNVQALGDGSARKYCLKTTDSRTVRFIVARGSDGKIRVVLDACRTCYRNNLGYKLSGREIFCAFCSNRYSIDSISAGRASCMPLVMPFEEHAGLLKIQLSDLKKGEGFFPVESAANEALASAMQWYARLMRKKQGPTAILSNTD
jgi:uncharacterized membrane protein